MGLMILIDVTIVLAGPVCCPNAPVLPDTLRGGMWEGGLANRRPLYSNNQASPQGEAKFVCNVRGLLQVKG